MDQIFCTILIGIKQFVHALQHAIVAVSSWFDKALCSDRGKCNYEGRWNQTKGVWKEDLVGWGVKNYVT